MVFNKEYILPLNLTLSQHLHNLLFDQTNKEIHGNIVNLIGQWPMVTVVFIPGLESDMERFHRRQAMKKRHFISTCSSTDITEDSCSYSEAIIFDTELQQPLIDQTDENILEYMEDFHNTLPICLMLNSKGPLSCRLGRATHKPGKPSSSRVIKSILSLL